MSQQSIAEVRAWQGLKQEPMTSLSWHRRVSGIQERNLPSGCTPLTNTAFGSRHWSTIIGQLHFGAYLCLYNIHLSQVQVFFWFIFSFLFLGSLAMFCDRADTTLPLYGIGQITMVCLLSVVGIVVQYEDV